MSTHHLVDLLIVHDIVHRAVQGTSALTSSAMILQSIGDLWRRAVCHGQSGAKTQQVP